jgi:hypothetical protein
MNGVELIAAERKRQVEGEGWDAEHDAQHTEEQLAWAACYYAMPGSFRAKEVSRNCFVLPIDVFKLTKWNAGWAKRGAKDRIRQLTVAGALIAAEIDRLLAKEKENHEKKIHWL